MRQGDAACFLAGGVSGALLRMSHAHTSPEVAEVSSSLRARQCETSPIASCMLCWRSRGGSQPAEPGACVEHRLCMRRWGRTLRHVFRGSWVYMVLVFWCVAVCGSGSAPCSPMSPPGRPGSLHKVVVSVTSVQGFCGVLVASGHQCHDAVLANAAIFPANACYWPLFPSCHGRRDGVRASALDITCSAA